MTLEVAITNLVTSSLSVLGSSSILIYITWKLKCQQKEIFPLRQIWMGDLLAAMFQCTGSLLSILKTEESCNRITTLTPGFYLVTFLLIMLYTLDMYIQKKQLLEGKHQPNVTYLTVSSGFIGVMVSVRSTKFEKDLRDFNSGLYCKSVVSCKGFYILYVLAWVVPLVFSVSLTIVMLEGESFPANSCYPVFNLVSTQSGSIWVYPFPQLFFCIPLFLVMVINVTLCVAIFRMVKRYNRRRGVRERRTEQILLKRMVSYQIVFFICWLPSIVMGIISIAVKCDGDPFIEKYEVGYMFQAVLAPLQGLINAIVYGWSRILQRESPPERTPLLKPLNVFKFLDCDRKKPDTHDLEISQS